MALTNTITYSNISSSLRMTALISNELHLRLRDVSSLRNTVWMTYAGSINGSGSNSVRYRIAGLDGFDSFAAATPDEDSDMEGSATALTKSHVDITAARQFLIYSLSDLATLTGRGQDIDPVRIAMSMMGSYEARFAELTCDSASTATNIKGTSSDDFSVDLFMSGLFELEKSASGRGAVGPYLCMLHPSALVSLQDSLRNEVSNLIVQQPEAAEVIKINGGQFESGRVGSLLGCDVWRSSYINQAAGARQNFMCGIDALAYVDGVPEDVAGASEFMIMDKVLVEMDRRATRNVTAIVGSMYLGCSLVDQERIVRLDSKA